MSSLLPVIVVTHHKQNEVVARLKTLKPRGIVRERANREALRDVIREMELGIQESQKKNLSILKEMEIGIQKSQNENLPILKEIIWKMEKIDTKKWVWTKIQTFSYLGWN